MEDDPFAPSRAYLAWLDGLQAQPSAATREKWAVIDAGAARVPDTRTPLEASADVPRWLAPSLRLPVRRDPEGRIYQRSSKK